MIARGGVVTGRIVRTTRLNNTADGNPQWRVNLSDGTTFDTAPDVQCAYLIGNPEFRDVPVVFALDKRGQILTATPRPDLGEVT